MNAPIFPLCRLIPRSNGVRFTGSCSTLLAAAVLLAGAIPANAADVSITDGTNPWTDTSGLNNVTLLGSATLGANNIVGTLNVSPTDNGKSLSNGGFSSVTILSGTLNALPNNVGYNSSGVDFYFGATGTATAVINQTDGLYDGSGLLHANGAILNLGGSGFNLAGDQSSSLTGTITLNTGVFRMIGYTGAKLAPSSDVVINGGSFLLYSDMHAAVATVTLNGGGINELYGTNSLTANSFALKSGFVGANLAGAASSLTKSTAGTVALSGANAYTGATAVTAGTLLLSGAGSINSTSGVSVSAGAEITNNSSTPFTQQLTLAEGATISGTGAFTGSNLTITADLSDGLTPFSLGATLFTKDGNLELTLSGITGGAYTLFSGSALSGQFDTLTIGGISLASLGAGNFGGTVGGSAFAFTSATNSLSISAVPEPTSCALLAVGLAIVAVRRRRLS